MQDWVADGGGGDRRGWRHGVGRGSWPFLRRQDRWSNLGSVRGVPGGNPGSSFGRTVILSARACCGPGTELGLRYLAPAFVEIPGRETPFLIAGGSPAFGQRPRKYCQSPRQRPLVGVVLTGGG